LKASQLISRIIVFLLCKTMNCENMNNVVPYPKGIIAAQINT
jgi:hypothetical protein